MRVTTDGVRDVLFSEAREKKRIESTIRNVFRNRGYDEIISPTLEFYNLFNEGHWPISEEVMYKLLDRKGNILVLRPDMTLPIARIISSRMKSIITPTKVFYTCNVYRINESLKGKLNEFTQGGIEIIGSSSIKADVEVIVTAISTLRELGFSEFKIEIGHSGFYGAITKKLNLNREKEKELKELVENKNSLGIKKFLKDKHMNLDDKYIDLFTKLPNLFGNMDIIHEVESLIEDKDEKDALEEIKNIYYLVDSLGLSKYLSIDLGMIQDMSYYTGIVLKGYVNNLGEIVLSGGRYDKLFETFGEKMPATGMAINIDSLAQLVHVEDKVKNKKILIWYESDFIKEASYFYKELKYTYKVEMCLLDSKYDCIKYFNEKSYDYLIEISSLEMVYIRGNEETIEIHYDKVVDFLKGE
ncbi:MAG: ATP phosphoribosyltransferase regulatory subunit [Anaeromicrobium sp.]|jgi:ATP phosphoribosyltransferase regulatory subunit|uniref:ATP phosphoribosyltransferase regulatory subunit n=1 Tax=Anaeromicrobium sp. TaxID=1929132 RepID=UPI0025F2EF60|nr:ATP phosphoribosyltransferase regulatory subunit [Anaeromicrobium sp.]MCT4593898.1 ATP phosphoribosyltransferase regulatory subunit [Anaeromicrobium sp.]